MIRYPLPIYQPDNMNTPRPRQSLLFLIVSLVALVLTGLLFSGCKRHRIVKVEEGDTIVIVDQQTADGELIYFYSGQADGLEVEGPFWVGPEELVVPEELLPTEGEVLFIQDDEVLTRYILVDGLAIVEGVDLPGGEIIIEGGTVKLNPGILKIGKFKFHRKP